MDKMYIAGVLRSVGDMFEIKGENIFLVGAYRKAAEGIAGFEGELAGLPAAGASAFPDIPGVGSDMAEKVREIVETGTLLLREELRKEFPPGFIELLELEDVGPLDLKKLYRTLGVYDLEQLERYCSRGDIASMRGFGLQKERSVLSAVELFNTRHRKWSLACADRLADEVVSRLRSDPAFVRVEKTGRLRRGCASLEKIGILAVACDEKAALRCFQGLPGITGTVEDRPEQSVASFDSGIHVALELTRDKDFGAVFMCSTGSPRHYRKMRRVSAMRGYMLGEKGLCDAEGRRLSLGSEEEEAVYAKLEMQFIPPEMREDCGEIEAAVEGRLPRALIMGSDIKGDLHVHTSATDGRASALEMILAAKKKGYEYVAITDHTGSLEVAGGLDAKRTRENLHRIRRVADQVKGIKVLAGSEVDILRSGELDMPEEVLAEMDIVIVAVHSYFDLDRDSQTERVLNALSHPRVNILAHPTSSMIVSRRGIRIDLERVFAKCAAKGIALEVNAHNGRLDLNGPDIRAARQYGALISICTDAHETCELDDMRYGVMTARKGWLEKEAVINCMGYHRLVRFFAKRSIA